LVARSRRFILESAQLGFTIARLSTRENVHVFFGIQVRSQ